MSWCGSTVRAVPSCWSAESAVPLQHTCPVLPSEHLARNGRLSFEAECHLLDLEGTMHALRLVIDHEAFNRPGGEHHALAVLSKTASDHLNALRRAIYGKDLAEIDDARATFAGANAASAKAVDMVRPDGSLRADLAEQVARLSSGA